MEHNAMPSLTILAGNQTNTQFVLGNRTLSIGRDPTRDIQLTDPTVSRKHALLRCEDLTHILTPTRSFNSILINGQPIQHETTLAEGDEITLGQTILRYELNSNDDKTNAVFNRKANGRDLRENNTIR